MTGPSTTARRRTLLLVAGQIAVIGGLASLSAAHDSVPGAMRLPAVVMAPLFAISAVLGFNLEQRKHTHTFNFSEIPLVLGLFFAAPSDLLGGRILGGAVALLLQRRWSPLKVAVNLATSAMETAVALAIFSAVLGAPSVRTPAGWAAAFACVLASDIVGTVVIGTVIRWHGGAGQTGRLAATAGVSAAANSSLGVVAAILLDVHVGAPAVLGAVGAVLLFGYRRYLSLAERYASLQVLHEFGEKIGGALRPDDVVEAMLHHARRLLRADVAELLLLDGGVRVRLAGDGEPESTTLTVAERRALSSVPPGVATLQPRGCPVDPRLRPYAASLGCADFLVIPLEIGEARCALAVGDRLAEVSTFDEEDARLFATLAGHAAIAIEKNELIEKLQVEARRREYQALHDDLTGLPNRPHFHERCSEALGQLKGDAAVGVLVMDLDLFKEINDTLGHQTGDDLLVEVARRISGAIAAPDVAARLGGDEFAILIHSPGSEHAVLEAARRIRAAVQAPIPMRGLELDIRASIGAAVAPQHGADPAALLQHADIAMYTAKRNQTGAELYSSEVDQHSPRRLQLAGELRRAIDDEQLIAHFQPKADLRTGCIAGAEALVRWPHSSLGPVFPDEFIPVAEQTGLITPLTMLVLRQAISSCLRWQSLGHDVGVAVNIATRSLLDPNFTADVQSLLARSGLPARSLTLEITESAIMSDTRRALDVLEDLAGLGIRLSVDDFGTGYSSLSYLQRLPVHELKVDKSFVFRVAEDPASRAIIRSVIELGHSLGLSVVAEGVENQLAWDHLLALGCDVGQGYFLSRPIPAGEMLDWMQRRDENRTTDRPGPRTMVPATTP